MAITVRCKSCGMQFRAKEEWIGKRAKCTYCGRIIIIKRTYVALNAQSPKNRSNEARRPPKSKGPEPSGPLKVEPEAKPEQPPAVKARGASRPDESETFSIAGLQEATAPATPAQRNCDICAKPTLALSEIDEEDARKRRAASAGREEYTHGFYKALSERQGYRCAGCGRIFCEKCLTARSPRKTNVENIVCMQCGGKLVIRR